MGVLAAPGSGNGSAGWLEDAGLTVSAAASAQVVELLSDKLQSDRLQSRLNHPKSEWAGTGCVPGVRSFMISVGLLIVFVVKSLGALLVLQWILCCWFGLGFILTANYSPVKTCQRGKLKTSVLLSLRLCSRSNIDR